MSLSSNFLPLLSSSTYFNLFIIFFLSHFLLSHCFPFFSFSFQSSVFSLTFFCLFVSINFSVLFLCFFFFFHFLPFHSLPPTLTRIFHPHIFSSSLPPLSHIRPLLTLSLFTFYRFKSLTFPISTLHSLHSLASPTNAYSTSLASTFSTPCFPHLCFPSFPTAHPFTPNPPLSLTYSCYPCTSLDSPITVLYCSPIQSYTHFSPILLSSISLPELSPLPHIYHFALHFPIPPHPPH